MSVGAALVYIDAWKAVAEGWNDSKSNPVRDGEKVTLCSELRDQSEENGEIGVAVFLFLKETEMSNELPQIAGTSPKAVELVAGKQYAFCTCGRSGNQPFCDGAHKVTSFTPHVFTAEKSGEAWLCMCKRTGNAPYCDGTHKTLDPPKSS